MKVSDAPHILDAFVTEHRYDTVGVCQKRLKRFFDVHVVAEQMKMLDIVRDKVALLLDKDVSMTDEQKRGWNLGVGFAIGVVVEELEKIAKEE